MSRKSLSDRTKADIVHGYTVQKLTQEQLAKLHQTSRKTIYRVLVEKGVLPPQQRLKPSQKKLLDMLEAAGIKTQEQLQNLFNQPALTVDNMSLILSQLPLEQFLLIQHRLLTERVEQLLKDRQQAQIQQQLAQAEAAAEQPLEA